MCKEKVSNVLENLPIEEKRTFLNSVKQIVNNTKSDNTEAIFTRLLDKIELGIQKVVSVLPEGDEHFLKVEYITPQKYDIIKVKSNGSSIPHYYICYKTDKEFNIVWCVPITSDSTLENAIPVDNSRFVSGYMLGQFEPIPLIKNCYKIYGIIDFKREFDEVCKAIKNYYKRNFKL